MDNKTYFLLIASLWMNLSFSQVGIGTTDPKTTLQVNGTPTNTALADGIKAPVLSLTQLEAKGASYGNDQDGAIVFINDVSNSSTLPETAGVTSRGHYYYDATSNLWIVMNGDSSSSGGTSSTTYTVGDFAHGGIVFWVDESENHGLVVAKEDQSLALRWNAGTNGFTQANGNGLLAGKSNTSIIIASHIAIGDDGSTNAARICNELEVVQGGNNYGDWYLPSISELKLIYDKRSFINPTATSNGGTALDESANANYWSSTETSDANAEYQRFDNGENNDGNKDQQFIVRAVRSF